MSGDNAVFKGMTLLNYHFSFEHMIIYGVVAIAIIIAFISARRYARIGIPLFLIRSSLILLLLLIFWDPAWEYIRYDQRKKNVIIVVDNSRSMTINQRLGRIQSFFKQKSIFWEKFKKEFNIHTYTLDQDIRSIEFDAIGMMRGVGESSLIQKGLKKIFKEHYLKNIAGLIVVSDFRDTGKKVEDDLFKMVDQLQIPVNLILPQKRSFKDVTIKKLKYDSYAFVQNKTVIECDIEMEGYSPRQSQVTLLENMKPLQQTQIILEQGKTSQVRFELKPEKVGYYVYQIKVSPLPGEMILENNERYFMIKVVRDKIRVVHVVGQPTWDVRYLRETLKNHPDIDLVSFFILRTINDISLVSVNDLSLIPFPTHELFYDKLKSFDLVIFQNFNYLPYQIGRYFKNIKAFVEQRGGGFIMIGGERSFTSGGYAGTIIEDILPLSFPRGVKNSISLKDTSFKITAGGFESPFFKFNAHPSERQQIIKSLPQVEGFNITTLKGGATLLAETGPIKSRGNKRFPLVAVQEQGKGRTMAITSDSMWHWMFHRMATISHQQLYSYFWDQAIKWLIRDPDLNLIKVSLNRDVITPRGHLIAVIKGYDFKYKPLSKGQLSYKITNLKHKRIVRKGHLIFDHDGVVTLREKPLPQGAYGITLSSFEQGHQIDQTQEMFIVQEEHREFEQPTINYSFIKKVTQSKNITSITSDQSPEKLQILRKQQAISERIYHSAWDRWWVLLILLSLLLGEIYLKRFKA